MINFSSRTQVASPRHPSPAHPPSSVPTLEEISGPEASDTCSLLMVSRSLCLPTPTRSTWAGRRHLNSEPGIRTYVLLSGNSPGVPNCASQRQPNVGLGFLQGLQVHGLEKSQDTIPETKGWSGPLKAWNILHSPLYSP